MATPGPVRGAIRLRAIGKGPVQQRREPRGAPPVRTIQESRTVGCPIVRDSTTVRVRIRRRVRRPVLATHGSSIGVFHWQHLGLRLGFGAPSGRPCLESFPDLLDGQRLDGQALRPLEVTLAFDGAEGGFLGRVERFPHDFPVERVGTIRRAGGRIRRGPANVPGQPLYADELEAARSVRVRVDLDRLPESEPKLAEVEGTEVLRQSRSLGCQLALELDGFLLERLQVGFRMAESFDGTLVAKQIHDGMKELSSGLLGRLAHASLADAEDIEEPLLTPALAITASHALGPTPLSCSREERRRASSWGRPAKTWYRFSRSPLDFRMMAHAIVASSAVTPSGAKGRWPPCAAVLETTAYVMA